MGEFFWGWRRKIGCVTLFMACAAMGGWLRSSAIQDTFTIALGSSMQMKLVSVSHRLVIVKLSIEGEQSLLPKFWLSQDALANAWDLDFLFRDSSRMCMRNSVTSDVYSLDNAAMSSEKTGCEVTWIQFPYCFIAIPLTLIALWFLLSTPRKSNQMKLPDSLRTKIRESRPICAENEMEYGQRVTRDNLLMCLCNRSILNQVEAE